MGLFNFFKKEEMGKKPKNNILLAMPMFMGGESYKTDLIIQNLKTYWKLNVTDITGDDGAICFTIDGETVAIADMPVPIPWDDIEGTAEYAYNWTNAITELKDHSGHAFVTLMGGKKSPLERYKIFSKVLYSFLVTSNSIGVYQGNQSLLVSRSQYLATMEELEGDDTPVSLWIYIGLRKLKTGNSAYTYGLKEFGKKEFEVIDSKLDIEELYGFLLNISSYVIDNDVILKSGETIGLTEDQKILITLSKGQFIEGESLKLTI